jgi:hypothetical protein
MVTAMVRSARARGHVAKHVVNLADTHWDALRTRAFEQRTSVSEQVRRAVARYLAREARR